MRRMYSLLQLKAIAQGVVNEVVPDIAEQLIQADKDVLSKIVETSNIGYYKYTFPKYILPLKLEVNLGFGNLTRYFDYENMIVLNSSGQQVSGVTLDLNADGCVVIKNESKYITKISLEYILFDGTSLGKLNTYLMYNPVTSSGTKLYKHVITGTKFTPTGGTETDATLSFVSKSSSPVTDIGNSGLSEYLFGMFLSSLVVFYITRQGATSSIFKYFDNSGDVVSGNLDWTTFTDTVTEL